MASLCHIQLLPPVVPPTLSRMEKPSVHGRLQARMKILGDVMFYFMVQNHHPGALAQPCCCCGLVVAQGNKRTTTHHRCKI